MRQHAGGRRRRQLRVCHNQLRRGPGERHAPGDDFVGDDGERVEVASPINALRLGLFRRDVLRRAHKHAGARQALAI